MKKIRIAAAAAAAALLTAGCSAISRPAGFSPAANCAYIEKDGSVQWASVEELDGDGYTQEGLADFAGRQISAFNKARGAGEKAENEKDAQPLPAALVSASLKDGKAVLLTEYDSPDRLVEFAREIGDYNVPLTAFAVGTAADYRGELSGVSLSGAGGKAKEASSLEEKAQIARLETTGEMLVKTEGKIAAVSEGCLLVDEHTAQTAASGASYLVIE